MFIYFLLNIFFLRSIIKSSKMFRDGKFYDETSDKIFQIVGRNAPSIGFCLSPNSRKWLAKFGQPGPH